jgi:hypothetical protein
VQNVNSDRKSKSRRSLVPAIIGCELVLIAFLVVAALYYLVGKKSLQPEKDMDDLGKELTLPQSQLGETPRIPPQVDTTPEGGTRSRRLVAPDTQTQPGPRLTGFRQAADGSIGQDAQNAVIRGMQFEGKLKDLDGMNRALKAKAMREMAIAQENAAALDAGTPTPTQEKPSEFE